MQVQNGSLTIFEAAARTATATSAEFFNNTAHGIAIFINVSAATATPSVTFSIEAYDEASKEWFTVFSAAAAVTGTGKKAYLLHAGVENAANANYDEADAIPLPYRWRMVATHADADSITYSVGAHLLI